jgi:ABC-type dipeptide/oligopeptide/nickel transport system permease component
VRGLVRKILTSLLAAAGATLLVTLFLNLVPGDPIEILLGEQAQRVDLEGMRKAMWLDRPVPVQAWLFVSTLVRGELRSSLPPFHDHVMPRVWSAFPHTAELAGLAVLLALCASLPLGIVSALRVGRPIDRAASLLSVAGVSAPSFLVGHVLILVFGIRLAWFPISGDDERSSVILPALTLALGLSALLSRVTRVSMLEVLGEDYVLAARARGLPSRIVVLRHALRNALLPILTVVGLQLGVVLTGAIVVEKVFAWPGLGTLLLSGIEKRDYNLVRACVLVFTLTYLAVNLFTDFAYALADPRVRRRGDEGSG